MQKRGNGLNALAQEFVAADVQHVMERDCPEWMNAAKNGFKCLGTTDTIKTMISADGRLGAAFTEKWRESEEQPGLYTARINYHNRPYRAAVMEGQPGVHIGYVVLRPDEAQQ